MMGKWTRNSRGVSLIFVVLILVIVGTVGAAFISIINTESFSALGASAGDRALGVANGGVEYILMNRPFPNYSLTGTSITLGDGSFTVDSPALTNAVVPGGAGVNIIVDSTNWFENNPAPGVGTVGIIINGEEIECASITPTTQFTTCNDFSGGPVTGGQPANTEIYPVTHLNTGGGPLNTTDCPTVNSTRGFLPLGIIRIENNENVYYTGTTATMFTPCTRGYGGTPASAHPDGRSVLQYVITSTGTVPTSVIGNAQRVVRVTVGP